MNFVGGWDLTLFPGWHVPNTGQPSTKDKKKSPHLPGEDRTQVTDALVIYTNSTWDPQVS